LGEIEPSPPDPAQAIDADDPIPRRRRLYSTIRLTL